MPGSVASAQATSFRGPRNDFNQRIERTESDFAKKLEESEKAGSKKGTFSSAMLMGKMEDWVKMLVTSMKNQSPDDPVSTKDLTQQISMFGQTSGMIEIKEMLEKILHASDTGQMLQAAQRLDQLIKVKGNQFTYANAESVELSFVLPEGSEKAAVTITDKEGRIINTIEKEAKPGEKSFIWDGKDFAGDQVTQGEYIFRVQALDGKGEVLKKKNGGAHDISTFVTGRATGGVMKGHTAHVKVLGTMYPLEDMTEVYGAPTKQNKGQGLGSHIPFPPPLPKEKSTVIETSLFQKLISEKANEIQNKKQQTLSS